MQTIDSLVKWISVIIRLQLYVSRLVHDSLCIEKFLINILT